MTQSTLIKPQHTWALLIGMGEFAKETQGTHLDNIPAVESNLDRLRELLTDSKILGIPPGQVVVMMNQSDILESVIDLVPMFPESMETLIVYYVGHGMNDKDQRLYLAKPNSRFGHPETALAFADLWEKTLDSPATNFIYILDCCLSGKAMNTAKQRVGKNISVLTATLPGDPALALPGETYTTFTKHLITLLEHGVVSAEPTLTTEAIRDALQKDFPTKVHDRSIPKPWGHDYLDTVKKLSIAYNLAYRPQTPTILQIPIPRNDYFTGRADLLQQLQERLPNHPVALSGLGGMGKTQLAVEYAYRQQAKYSAIFWLNASHEVVLHTGVGAIAKELGLNAELPPPDLRAVVKSALSKRRDWLLMVDNADELSILKLVLNEVLPRQLTGHVLVTTRHSAPPAPLKRLRINQLTDDQGAELLLRRTAELSSEFSQHPDYAAACQLSQTLDGLPLALAQAAAYLYKRQCGYPKYLSFYQRQKARLLQERGELLFDDDHPLPVATTWQVSLDQIQLQQPRALELLDYCAFLAPAGIPEEVLQAVLGIEEFDLEELLDPILSYSLLTRDAGSQQVQIHGLVQTVLREKLAKEKQRGLVEELVRVVVDLFSPPVFENWPACERLVSSALACAEGIERYQMESESVALLLNQTGYYLWQRGDYATVLPLWQRALEIREQVLGTDHLLTATSLNNLAVLYKTTGQYEQALPLFQRALEIDEQMLGDHPSTAIVLDNMATLYREVAKCEQALPLYERALEIRVQELGTYHPDTAINLDNLAGLYKEIGQYEKALLLYQRALKINERILEKNHPDTATNLNNLATLYHVISQYEQALPLYQRALEIREWVLGKDHPDTAETINNIGELYKATGQYEQALPLYERALTIFKNKLGTQHPITQGVAGNCLVLLEKIANQGEASTTDG